MDEAEVEAALDAAEDLAEADYLAREIMFIGAALSRITAGHTDLVRGVLVQRGLDADRPWSLGPHPGGSYWTWRVITHEGAGSVQRRVYGPYTGETLATRAILREALRLSWFPAGAPKA